MPHAHISATYYNVPNVPANQRNSKYRSSPDSISQKHRCSIMFFLLLLPLLYCSIIKVYKKQNGTKKKNENKQNLKLCIGQDTGEKQIKTKTIDKNKVRNKVK